MIHTVGFIPTIDENESVTYGTDYIVVSSEILPDMDMYRVQPADGYPVISGVETYYYAFESEAVANELLGLSVEAQE